MSDDDKKKVNIEDLPVPLKDLDKEEQDNISGGVTGINNPNPTPVGINPTINPRNPNPDLNPTLNR